MAWTAVLYWLLPRRLRSSWPVLAVSSFGIVAAVTLMAVGAAYSHALAEGGLRHVLASNSSSMQNVYLITQNRPIGAEDYRNLRAFVEQTADSRLGDLLRTAERYGVAQGNLRMARVPWVTPPSLEAPVGRPFFLTGLEQHSKLVEGRWPEGSPVLGDQGVALEAVLGQRAARNMALKLGSQVDLVPFAADSSERISLTVVGLAEALDPDDEYWMSSPHSFFSLQEVGDQVVVPFFLTEESFFGGLAAKYPSLVGDFTWFLFLNTGVLTSSDVKPTQTALKGLETDINRRFPRSLVFSGLKVSTQEYQRGLMLARVPLFLFLSLVVLVILYFLVLVMGLLARSRMDEANLLRSRGASLLQVSSLLVMAEGMVAIAAMIAGPFLALAIVRYLLLPTINPAGEAGETLPVGLSADMFLMGALGGILSLVVLVATSINRARLGMVESLRARARPPTLPLLQRYYVDLLVLAAVAFLMWEIQGREGFVVRDLSSQDLKVDLVLLFGPVLALLGAAVLALRMLPWLAGLAAWAAERWGPAWVAFTMARFARDPLPHGSLVVILMLAAALGVFGAMFQSSLSLSQTHQALYQTGGDVVLEGASVSASANGKLSAEPAVRSFSPIFRETGILLDGFPSSSVALIGVDPNTLAETTWFRNDFAAKSLAQLVEALKTKPLLSSSSSGGPSLGVAIPGDTRNLGIWLAPREVGHGTLGLSLNVWTRLYDAQGGFHNLFLGEVTRPSSSPRATVAPDVPDPSGSDWTYLEAKVPPDINPSGEPLRLVSVFFSRKSFAPTAPGKLYLDDITVKGPSTPAGGLVVEGYEQPGGWLPLINDGDAADIVEVVPQAARTGKTGLSFGWEEPFRETPRGTIIPPSLFPIPAIGDASLPAGQVLRVSVGRQLFPVVVRETTRYFPTLNPSSGPFLILPYEAYRQYLQRSAQSAIKSPEEFWVALDQSAHRGQALGSLQQLFTGFVRVRDRDQIVEVAQRNPLAGGGWNGLTILGMSAIVGAVLLTLIIHAVVAVHTGRVDLVVAGTLGLSRSELFRSLALERMLTALPGLVAGSAVGVLLGRWVLGFLDVTPSGTVAIPPMVLSVQEWLVALVLGGLVFAALLGLLVGAVSVRRLKAADILRAGE